MSGCDVSVIICTRDRAESLAQVFPTLSQQILPAGISAELLVVDNGSRDGTLELLRRQHAFGAPLRVVEEPEPGLSRARNAGIEASRGRVLLFTDDDVRLPPTWVAGMASPLLDGSADAVAGSVELAPQLVRPWMEPLHRATLAATDLLRPEEPGVMMGASMGFGRHVLDSVPEFDVRLGAGALGTAEETLFAWQLVEAGFRLARVETPAVEHHCSPERLARTAFLDAAAKLGRSYAYISYHWLHTTHLDLDGRNGLQLAMTGAMARLRLARWRLRNPSSTSTVEGISRAEYYLVLREAFIRQYRRERKGPRRYAPRKGAVPRANPGPWSGGATPKLAGV